MKVPLPQHSPNPWLTNQSQANMGLLFNRFFAGYNNELTGIREPIKATNRDPGDPGGKAEFATHMLRAWGQGTATRQAACTAYAQRLAALATAQTQAVLGTDTAQPATQTFQAKGRWLTGSGISHPSEVGLAFHHTLGVPYLCGAGIKGLVRAWLTNASAEGASPETLKQYEQLFGSPQTAGQLVFFDAIPTGLQTLEKDIMTPHYTGWYQWDETAAGGMQNGQTMPADWHNPIPVPFLTAGPAMQLQFAIAPSLRMKSATREAVQANLALAWQWLEGALYWYGAGAKTAAGYGRFEKV